MPVQKCITEISFRTDLQNLTTHRHNTYQMIYVTRGELHATIAAHEYDVDAPSVIFINSLEHLTHKLMLRQVLSTSSYNHTPLSNSSLSQSQLACLSLRIPQTTPVILSHTLNTVPTNSG